MIFVLKNITSAEMKDGKVVIFIHIPKSAGTTLRNVLKSQYKKEEIYEISHQPNLLGSIKDFIGRKEQVELSCVMGHIPFGIDRFIDKECSYITFLRNPIDRVVSYYYFAKRTPSQKFHSYIDEYNMSLRDFVVSGLNPEIENGITKQISGRFNHLMFIDEQGNQKKNCSDEEFYIAKDNLKKFDKIGFTDDFDRSLLSMKSEYGWSGVSYAKGNASKTRPTIQEIDNQTIHEIRKRNKYDIRLYKFARRYLKEKSDLSKFEFFKLKAISSVKTKIMDFKREVEGIWG